MTALGPKAQYTRTTAHAAKKLLGVHVTVLAIGTLFIAVSLIAVTSAPAVDAVWNPATDNWNLATNWVNVSPIDPPAAPVNEPDTATFLFSNITSPSLSSNVAIKSIIFNSGAPEYLIQTGGNSLGLKNGVGIVNHSGRIQTISNSVPDSIVYFEGIPQSTVLPTAGDVKIINSGDRSLANFSDSTAENATIENSGFQSKNQYFGHAKAGDAKIDNIEAETSVFFNGASTAERARITNSGDWSDVQFASTTKAGNATIENKGPRSFAAFREQASGENAVLINSYATAFITIAELDSTGTTFGSIAGNGAIFLGSKSLAVGGNHQSTTFSGVISDEESPDLKSGYGQGSQTSYKGGSFTKVGNGTLTLAGDNTYTGVTTVTTGTLQLGNGGITGSITGNVANNAILAVNRSDAFTFAGVISGTGRVQQNGTGTTVFVGNNTYTGGTMINGGTLQLGSGGTTGSIVGDVVNSGILAFNRSDSFTFGGAISGSGSVQQNGTGTTVFGGNNSYTGGTNLNGGIVAVVSDGNLGTGQLRFNGGTLQTLAAGGGIISDKPVNLDTGGGTFLADAGTLSTLSGVLTGPGALTKAGTGILTLTGVSTYGGGTNMNGGILAVVSESNLGTGPLGFNGGTLRVLGGGGGINSSKPVALAAGGGTFLVDAGATSTLSGALTGPGSLTKGGAGALTLTGENTYTGGTTITNGALQLGNGGTTGSLKGGVTVSGNGTLAFNRSNSFTFDGVISGTGNVQQNGSGTTVFVGNNTYTGLTIINAGTLQLGNGGTTGSIVGNVVNNGILAFNRSGSFTFAGAISGAGSVLLNGPGTTALTGNNTYSGGTIIAAGTILAQNASALGTGPLAFGDGTTLQVQGALDVGGDWTVPGTATVSGGTVQALEDFSLVGGGTLIANSNFNVPGAASINSSDIVVNSEFTVGGDIDLNGNSEAIVNGVLASPMVNVNNNSSLIVNTPGAVAGSVSVAQSAQLELFGAIKGSVANAGFLQGTGVVKGNLVNSGTVSPGTSPGTLTVNGNYTQNSEGTLRIEVAGRSPGQFDLLAVSGRANLAGNLQLVRVGGFKLRVGDRIAFLTADGGVSGTFDNVENDFVTGTVLKGEPVFLPNAVVLALTQGSFVEFAVTPNEVAVATALDSAVADPRASELMEFLNNEPLEDLRTDFNLISPDELSSIYVTAISLANVQTSNLGRRMSDIRAGSVGFSAAGFAIKGNGPSFEEGFAGVSGPEGKSGPAVFAPGPENRWGVFATGVGEFTNVDSTFNSSGYDLETGGFTAGIDYRIGSNFAIGLMGGYAYTGVGSVNDGSIQVNGGKLGLYATAFGSGFYLDAAVSGGLNGYDTRRSALEGAASGSTEGGELNVLVAGGYDWRVGGLTFGPTANFQYTYVGFDGFTEGGSLAPLKYPDQHAYSARTAFGMKASYDWKLGPIRVIPEVRGAWQHEYGTTAYPILANFANGAGNSFTVYGPAIGRDSLLLSAGFAIQWNERISTYAYYDGELFRTNYLSNNVSAGLRVTF